MSLKHLCNKRLYSRLVPTVYSSTRNKNPMKKTIDVLSLDMPSIISKKKAVETYPEHTDIVVIGGGYIGTSAAYWLKTRAGEGLSIVVLEKDFTYKEAQSTISLGTLTQHFSLPENINLAKHSIDFLRAARQHLYKDCDIQYTPTGSLVLASEKYVHKLEENALMLNELGVKNKLLTPSDLNEKFPWISTQDVKLGCMAMEGEGLFNSWALLKGLIQKSKELGTTYVNAEVINFELEKQKDVLMEGVTPGTFKRINKVIYKTPDDEVHELKFAICVLAAGHNSGQLATLAGIGTGDDMLQAPLPIEKREYNVYSIEDKGRKTGLSTPLVTDSTGLWLLRNPLEDNLLCGCLPMMKDDTQDMTETDYFENIIKASLQHRVPMCTDAKINKRKTDSHDCNTFDNSGVLGPHPYHNNLYIAAGFGRYGCQHAPGIGRAIAELVIDSQYTTIDLTRFGFDRFLMNDPLVEFNVY